ncbi:MAG: hypothetical protein ABH851_02100, partial [Methanobacteriota archaeon]
MINIEGVIDGYLAHFQYEETIKKDPQEFLVNWENIGSASCLVRMRVDVMNSTNVLSTAWSNEAGLNPGDNNDLRAYWYPQSPGDYSANTTIHYCHLIINGPSVNFTVEELTEPTPVN